MVVKRGVIVWISAFVTFLAVLCSFAMAILSAINEDPSTVVSPYILVDIFGDLSIEIYLWISVTMTFIFLGITSIIVYRKQPPDPEIIKMFLKVGGNLAALRKAQEASITETADQLEYNRKVNQKFFSNIKSDLEGANNKMLNHLDAERKNVKKIRLDLISTIEKKAVETGEKLSADLIKQEKAIIGAKRANEESVRALKKQQLDLEEIKHRLEKIEGNMIPNQAILRSFDNPKSIKGIGPSLGKELASMGITSVGDFLTSDAVVIGENTRVSQEVAENLQALAQLMMVPGIDANEADMLVEAGIRSSRELANQDLIQLSKRISEIAKIYVDQGKISKDEYPTIEEMAYWIRLAR